jgi:hypothetical protein
MALRYFEPQLTEYPIGLLAAVKAIPINACDPVENQLWRVGFSRVLDRIFVRRIV